LSAIRDASRQRPLASQEVTIMQGHAIVFCHRCDTAIVVAEVDKPTFDAPSWKLPKGETDCTNPDCKARVPYGRHQRLTNVGWQPA
jgi:hypothetical protein